MFDSVYKAIVDAQNKGMLKPPPKDVLSGFSGAQLMSALQRLTSLFSEDDNACYLEVGVFQGLTLLTTAFANSSIPCYGIDNFAFFDEEGANQEIIKQRIESLNLDNAKLINADYEDALSSLDSHIGGRRVAVYFVDGPHDYRSQRVCLDLILPHLHDNAVIIIDDCNYPHVRQATYDFLIARPEFKLIFEAYSRAHPLNLDAKQQAKARERWWNGVHIIARDPENQLPAFLPQTERSRALYEQDHKLHSSQFAQELTPIANHCMSFIKGSGVKKVKRALVLLSLLNNIGRTAPPNSYAWSNTGSDSLPPARFNPALTTPKK